LSLGLANLADRDLRAARAGHAYGSEGGLSSFGQCLKMPCVLNAMRCSLFRCAAMRGHCLAQRPHAGRRRQRRRQRIRERVVQPLSLAAMLGEFMGSRLIQP
jgi:hypothetical protein